MTRKTDPLLTLPDKEGVLYVRLYQRLRALILEGRWPAGMRLPSSRTIAADLGVSRNTASLALDQLLADGWIETRSRSGAFVSDAVRAASGQRADSDPRRPGKPPVPFELAPGAIDVFPFGRWAKLQAQIWSRFAPDLLYEGDPAGDPGLRQAIATIVAPARGLSVSSDDLIVVTSTQSAFDLIAAALPPGGTVIVEDPGYYFADDAFQRRGLKVVPAPVDASGLDVAAARAAAPHPALIVTGAATQFPLGVSMSQDRRGALLAWAAETGAWVIEDDFDAEAGFDGSPLPAPLRSEPGGDRVVSVASFSRILFRSLRLGFMAVPAELRPGLLATREASDAFVTLPDQLVLREFIERGHFSAHLRRCRDIHRERRRALLDLLSPWRGSLFEQETNSRGLYLVARPRKIPVDRVAAALRAAGIACTTIGQLSRLAPSSDGILLGFAAFTPDVIKAMRPAVTQALDGLT